MLRLLGEKNKNLMKRLQHKNNLKNPERFKTMLTEYINTLKHKMDFSNSIVLHFEKNLFKRRFAKDHF